MGSMIHCSACRAENDPSRTTCIRCGKPLAAPSSPDQAASASPQSPVFDTDLARRYTVVGIIGKGGMGRIYKARDNVLGETVALKTLLPQFVRDKMIVERFFNEARIARQLSHPNIIRVHDIGMTKGSIYISMELVSGRSLRELIESMPQGHRLPLLQTLRIFDDLCAALQYAHQFTIHRDLKPENVMIDDKGHAKLMDFGISKLMTADNLTATSMVMGTPFYMSPEQLRNSKDVDARSDIYSLGVMLYEILTGDLPRGTARPASTIRREVPPALDPIVSKCLEPAPTHRYQSVQELRDALQEIRELIESESSLEVPDGGFRATIHPAASAVPPREWARKLAAGFAAVLIVTAAAWGVFRLQSLKAAPAKPSVEIETPVPQPLSKNELTAFQASFDELRTNLESAISETDETHQRVFDLALSKWEMAEQAQDEGRTEASQYALEAYQCLVALSVWPSGMVFVPAGTVTLWDPTGTKQMDRYVSGFFIDEAEVTVDEYYLFCSTNNWPMPQGLDHALPNAPIVSVTYYDAQAYAATNDKKLPTEAQWVRAAYGGLDAPPQYPWGPDAKPGACNARGLTETGDTYPYAAPVKSFEEDRTNFGCYDMAGNVSEWCRTAYQPIPYPETVDGAIDNLYFGTSIIIRGGNFNQFQNPMHLSRRYAPYESTFVDLGFRCVRELPSDLKALQSLL